MCTCGTIKLFSDRNCGNVVGKQMKAINPKASGEIHQMAGKPRHHTQRPEGTRGSSGPNRTSSGQPRRAKSKQMKCKFCSKIHAMRKESCPAWGESSDACKHTNNFKNSERCPKSNRNIHAYMNMATLTLIVARVLASVQSLLLLFAQSNRLKIALSTATW